MGGTIVWFGNDLRTRSHAALSWAAEREGFVLPCFVWSPEEQGEWASGAASRWWLHHSLSALDSSLRALGSGLVVRRGPAARALAELARETGATSVAFTRSHEPAAGIQQRRVAEALGEAGVEARGFGGALVAAPDDLRNREGSAYRVFTPFWRAWMAGPDPPAPTPAPRRLAKPSRAPQSVAIEDLALLPRVRWDDGLAGTWSPGEHGARARLAAFGEDAAARYGGARDLLAGDAVSRLSPHLHFGEIAVHEAWHARREAGAARDDAFLRQLAWRDFAAHLLDAFPESPLEPLDGLVGERSRSRFGRLRWRRSRRDLEAWQRGRTGYPVVDAGMRELWRTGWMHGRARMVVASFLVKDLLLPWQEGARWFWDTLVDADLANDTLNWQWVAGCGADAAPFHRIFNPVLQGRRFDPGGAYVRRWVPELAALDARWIHSPWEAPPPILAAAGVELGRTYPFPMVDHAAARQRALEAFGSLR